MVGPKVQEALDAYVKALDTYNRVSRVGAQLEDASKELKGILDEIRTLYNEAYNALEATRVAMNETRREEAGFP